MTTDLKPYIDAMRLDMFKILDSGEEGKPIGVYELRRVQNLAKAVVDFVNGVNTPYETQAFADALRDTQDIAPMLNDALMRKTFTGDDAVREMYLALAEKYSTLDSAVQEANDYSARALGAGSDAKMDRLRQLSTNAGMMEVANHQLQSGDQETDDGTDVTDAVSELIKENKAYAKEGCGEDGEDDKDEG